MRPAHVVPRGVPHDGLWRTLGGQAMKRADPSGSGLETSADWDGFLGTNTATNKLNEEPVAIEPQEFRQRDSEVLQQVTVDGPLILWSTSVAVHVVEPSRLVLRKQVA